MFTNPDLFASRLIFVGLIIEAIEMLALCGAFADGGVFSRSNVAILTGGTRWHVRIGATFGGAGMMIAAMAAQLGAATVALVFGLGTSTGTAAALLCLVSSGYARSRRQIGGSGAEQLTFIVLVAFGFVMIAGGTESARRIGDVFVGTLLLLAYFASGASKAVSSIWRSGALAGVFSTEGYGLVGFGRLLARHPRIDLLLCWSVIIWECLFPLVLVAPPPVIMAFFAIGVVFHVSCAFVMGLNRFVWAFCGCYPSVWVTAMLLR
jgi:hypothetical protein